MRQPVVIIALVVASLFGRVGLAAAADFVVGSSGQGAYVINTQNNPTLTLVRGRTYTFDVTAQASGHPFWIKTVAETGTDNSFDEGVTNNGASPGLLTFAVPASAPPRLYYQCQYHEPMTGLLSIVSAPASATASAVPATPSGALGLLGLGLALSGAYALLRRVLGRKQPA